jgi:hypothetical protein
MATTTVPARLSRRAAGRTSRARVFRPAPHLPYPGRGNRPALEPFLHALARYNGSSLLFSQASLSVQTTPLERVMLYGMATSMPW